MASRSRVLIVVFDALRPDMVNDTLMPNLTAFTGRGVRFAQSRSSFPTETRVNQSTLITGCYPQRHGIVGNQFFDAVASPDGLLNTGNEDALREADARLDGRILDVPTLGELLYATGCTLATLSAGTPGGGRLLHHSAEKTGGFRLAMARPDATCAPISVDALYQRIGDIPKSAIPSGDWLRWSTDAFLQYIEPELHPDVSILWFCEPDNSYHRFGVGSPESETAIKAADTQFGRIVEWWQQNPEVQIITLSDHGQLAAPDAPIDIDQQLRNAGFSVGAQPSATQIASCLDTAGGLYLGAPDATLVSELVAFLAKQDWCSLISTRDGVGQSIRHSELFFDHARAPDIGIVMTANAETGPFGLPGTTCHASKYGGGGVHGGLSPYELHNWLAIAGNRMHEGEVCQSAAGIVDILPTVMTLLDLPIPGHVQGRILSEAFKAGSAQALKTRRDPPLPIADNLALHRQWTGQTPYLDGLIAH